MSISASKQYIHEYKLGDQVGARGLQAVPKSVPRDTTTGYKDKEAVPSFKYTETVPACKDKEVVPARKTVELMPAYEYKDCACEFKLP